jgi:Ala-tRNA(Pro) deacylase
MIPAKIIQYLDGKGINYRRIPHARAVSAQELATTLHISGERVVKTVLIEAESERCLAVLPACEHLDEALIADVLGARSIRVLEEAEFKDLFPDCEVGAEPPFGRLYDIKVVLDDSLADRNEDLVFRAGSHEEAVEMRYIDYERIERPIVAHIAREETSIRVIAVEVHQLI